MCESAHDITHVWNFSNIASPTYVLVCAWHCPQYTRIGLLAALLLLQMYKSVHYIVPSTRLFDPWRHTFLPPRFPRNSPRVPALEIDTRLRRVCNVLDVWSLRPQQFPDVPHSRWVVLRTKVHVNFPAQDARHFSWLSPLTKKMAGRCLQYHMHGDFLTNV